VQEEINSMEPLAAVSCALILPSFYTGKPSSLYEYNIDTKHIMGQKWLSSIWMTYMTMKYTSISEWHPFGGNLSIQMGKKSLYSLLVIILHRRGGRALLHEA
jgi:hypothetical protein